MQQERQRRASGKPGHIRIVLDFDKMEWVRDAARAAGYPVRTWVELLIDQGIEDFQDDRPSIRERNVNGSNREA